MSRQVKVCRVAAGLGCRVQTRLAITCYGRAHHVSAVSSHPVSLSQDSSCRVSHDGFWLGASRNGPSRLSCPVIFRFGIARRGTTCLARHIMAYIVMAGPVAHSWSCQSWHVRSKRVRSRRVRSHHGSSGPDGSRLSHNNLGPSLCQITSCATCSQAKSRRHSRRQTAILC
jgi:hypothetical protein